MRRKVVKISLLVIALMISITIPIIAVVAKKKEWILGPTYIDDSIPGFMWADYEGEPWLKGSGTEEDPYMIKNVVIDAGGYFFCMLIMNSEVYFKIMDCTFSNTGPYNSPDGRNAALILINTRNGVIFKNELFACGIPGSKLGGGVALVASGNNKVQKNFCHDNELSGIYLQYSNDNIIRQNLCTGNTYGIFIGEWSNNNEVTKNECYENEDHGIFLWTESNGNMITENDCSENLGSGINVESSHGNFITKNLCSGNIRPNIYLRYSNDNLITQNLCTGSGWGIVLRWSTNNEVTMNDCIENGEGIVLQQDSTDNRITDNTCTNNYENGILLVINANYNIIHQNNCSENLLSGILLMSSSGTVISKNDCNNNGESGISITDPFEINARDNILYGNKIAGNLNGIHFSEADLNDVFMNTIKENDIGMLVEGQSELNLIYHNNLIDNGVQASNEHAGLNNWHSIYMLEGNYWSDYTGTDSDGDGIGDTPWPWPDFDAYPFMEENGWENTTPLEDELLNVFFNPDFNRLGASRTVHANKTTYIMLGMANIFSERVHESYMPPYTIRLWFYGVEYYFQGNIWFFLEETVYGEPAWFSLFYMIIPANYFTDVGLPLESWYEFQWELSFYTGGELQIASLTSYFYLI